MKAKQTRLEVEAYRVTDASLPQALNALQLYDAGHWSINFSRTSGTILQVEKAGERVTAMSGDWLVKIRGVFRVVPDDLFTELFELEPETTLPTSVWFPNGPLMLQRQVSTLPDDPGENRVTGSYVEAEEAPHGRVKGFNMDFFPVADAVAEAKLLAPRVAKHLGWSNPLGMTRLVYPGSDRGLARFWFTVCDEYGYAIKEDK